MVGIVFKDLEGILIVGLPVYVLLLLTMCWRSLARAADTKTPIYILCAIGSVLFVISDGLIGVDMFLVKVPNARVSFIFFNYAFSLRTVFFVSALDYDNLLFGSIWYCP